MLKENITRRGFKRIIKSNGGYYIYSDNGRLIKFDRIYASDIVKFGDLYSHSSEINPYQIEWLSSLNGIVKNSSLPIGTVNYKSTAVGVIYPHYFYGFNSLQNISNEDSILFLQNIKAAILNNMELMQNGIYNNDFGFKNILYSGSHVELIDLDGKHIKRKEDSNPTRVYTYFIQDLRKSTYFKLIKLYGEIEAKKIMSEIDILFQSYSSYEEDTPLELVESIEKTKILK